MRSRLFAALLFTALLFLAIVGTVSIERHRFILRDKWRDLTMEWPGASVLNPVGQSRANPVEFEEPLAGTQMSSSQVRRIVSEIKAAGKGEGVNLLIFGLGHDSAYWDRVNSGGYTVFVEDSATWIEMIQTQYPKLEGKIFQYTYRTRLGRDATAYWDDHAPNGPSWESLFMFGELPRESPLVQLQGKFDVVIVDAPMGMQWCDWCVSRLQSLWTARVMARPGGRIIVDDCERMVEKTMSQRFYGDGTYTRAHFTPLPA